MSRYIECKKHKVTNAGECPRCMEEAHSEAVRQEVEESKDDKCSTDCPHYMWDEGRSPCGNIPGAAYPCRRKEK